MSNSFFGFGGFGRWAFLEIADTWDLKNTLRAALSNISFEGTLSHHIFIHPAVQELVNLQEVKGEAKPYQIRQFLRIVERYSPPLVTLF